MKHIRRFIRNISPKTLILVFYCISAWFIYGSIGQLIAVWSELFSGEQVTNLW
ncbi:hypothetical protein I4641_02425 [Waterburya agarophytonicola K14]|uniref:Uncharacterized protein n=1 Tax=Waterburya agarophytonicola KI4 TaxID=2874699 RepID=A0A964BNA2_9CYAN|nr:hypothetical protein [Waterburya agarophytonicola]MCC0175837.1 hypothetical protein [Waterburya agarophytonicola KI4]